MAEQQRKVQKQGGQGRQIGQKESSSDVIIIQSTGSPGEMHKFSSSGMGMSGVGLEPLAPCPAPIASGSERLIVKSSPCSIVSINASNTQERRRQTRTKEG